MCKISCDLKLTNSKTRDITKLKYYWLLLKKNNQAFETTSFGDLPVDQIENDKNYNYRILKTALNNPVSLYEMGNEQNGDKLLLYITCKAHENNFIVCFGDYAVYSFMYKNGIWKKCKYRQEEIIKNIFTVGKIMHPFPLKSKKERMMILF